MIDLRHGDCLEIMPALASESIDMILCDLPYGTTQCKWDVVIPFEPLWKEYKRVIKKNGVIILTATQPFASIAILSNPKWFKCEWIWVKSRSGSPLTAKYMPLKLHENILVFCERRTKTYNPQMTEGEPYERNLDHIGKENNHKFGIKEVHSRNNGTRFPSTVQKIKQNWSRQQQIHPTQKPVALMEYLIKTYTNEGDIVLDNAMGSGTTGLACKNLNRSFIGIEKEKDYFEIAQKRILG
jgi:site-specific DNA-methyltransferase (adenine-specific)